MTIRGQREVRHERRPHVPCSMLLLVSTETIDRAAGTGGAGRAGTEGDRGGGRAWARGGGAGGGSDF